MLWPSVLKCVFRIRSMIVQSSEKRNNVLYISANVRFFNGVNFLKSPLRHCSDDSQFETFENNFGSGNVQ